MDVMYARCAGLDVHKDTVVACVRLVVDGKVEREVRTFGTTTQDLSGAGRLVARAAVHARGDGVDGRVLEAGLARVGGVADVGAGQRDAHPQRAWSQDRRE